MADFKPYKVNSLPTSNIDVNGIYYLNNNDGTFDICIRNQQNTEWLKHRVVGGAEPPEGIAPISFFDSSDAIGNNWKNKLNQNQVYNNLIVRNSGEIASEGSFNGTKTEFHDGSAARILLPETTTGTNSTSLAFKPYTSKSLEAGSYIFRCKVKATNGGAFSLRVGMSASNLTKLDFVDGWNTLEFTFENTSTTGRNLYIYSDAEVGEMDILIDELQLYKDEVPPIFSEERNETNAKNSFYNIVKDGDYVSGVNDLTLYPSAYPNVTNLPNGFTIMMVIKTDQIPSSNQILFSTVANSYSSTTALSRYLQLLTDGTLRHEQGYVVGTGNIIGEGWHLVGITTNNYTTRTYINSLLIRDYTGTSNSITNAFSFHLLNRGGKDKFNGKTAMIKYWEQSMTQEEWENEVDIIKSELSEPLTDKVWYFSEGDSISADSNSFTYLQQDVLINGRKVGHLPLATGGHSLSYLESSLDELKEQIRQVKREASDVVVSVLVGANDRTSLIDNSAADAYYVRLKDYWSEVRSTGAKLVVCTTLPLRKTDAPNFENVRNYLNTLIKGDSSQYDALCDLGGHSIMGDYANTDSAVDNTYYVDGIHPSVLGYSLLVDDMTSAIENAL